MAFLAVRRVKYDGKKYSYQSPLLADGVNVLEGQNGSGKSTFSDLIYFGLGGGVDWFVASKGQRHAEIASDENNYVELLITIDGVPYTLKRFFATNDIGVHGDDTDEILPLHRRSGITRVFSDWLLAKLGIEAITLQYGTYSGKLNFTDLMRLVYHDQAPDPSGIFKSVDANSFVTDSKVFKEAIFEILIGKSFQEYYSTLAKYREAERNKLAAIRGLELFKEMSAQVQNGDDMNILFLDKKLGELRDQETKLLAYRRDLAKAPPPQDSASNLADIQRDYLATQLELSGLSRTEAGLLEEVSRLEQLKADLVLEATQLRKMMFAHEELQLFSSNTCPYCLKSVERTPHKCICGSDVLENDYEKFFYDSGEYMAILKSRQKNVETVDIAIKAAKEDLVELRRDKTKLENIASRIEKRIAQAVDDTNVTINLQQFENAEASLASVRDEIGKLTQQRELEVKREQLEQDVNTATIYFDSLRIKVDELGAAAQADIQAKKISFSQKYNELMRKTITDCRSASIGGDYMPVVNGGEYTEASQSVPKRLLYYATMLYMSLTDHDVKFPRFLLIDTPETAGIDDMPLKDSLSRVVEVVQQGLKDGNPSQVILTTGLGKYPDGLKPFATMYRRDGARLLIAKPVKD